MAEKDFWSRDIAPSCSYCKKGQPVSGGKEIFCLKRGLMSADDSCRSYRYDPLSRVPAASKSPAGYDPEDMKL